MTLLNKVERCIREERLIEEGETVVVAVSGGPDSVGLLHILHTLSSSWNFHLIVAHVNHMFRGSESEQEAAYVSSLAALLELPCEVAHINISQYIEETSLNAQVAAREKRYAFLHDVAERYNASKIVLGHHADDQAETVLMRIIRGVSPSGLAGIPIKRREKKVELIRPLLRIFKEEIEEYCRLQGLRVCRDSSNENRKYFRNQIRLDVLPFLETYNGQLSEGLIRLSEMIGPENDYLEQETRLVFEQHVTKNNEMYSIDRKSFVGLHVALQRRVIKLILSYLFSDSDFLQFFNVEQIRLAIWQRDTSSLFLDLPGGVRLVREYDHITLKKNFDLIEQPYQYVIDPFTSNMEVPQIEGSLFLEYLIQPTPEDLSLKIASRYEAVFDSNQLAYPLVVRNRRAGDRMDVFGLNGSKKVKDMFIDAKIPPSLRKQLPIIADDNGNILWVPGLRRSNRALVCEDTTHVLRIQLCFNDSSSRM